MGVFDPSPQRSVATGADYWRAAAQVPFSPWQNFSEQFQQTVLTNFASGTMIRGAITPQGNINTAPRPTGILPLDAVRDIIAAPGMIRQGIEQMTGDTQPSLTEEQFKSSPYYRKGVPFDPGMTADRQAALATFYDIAQSRAAYADKEAWNAFGVHLPGLSTLAGNLAGGLFDPVNFVPVFGPAARVAAVARLGFIGGHALIGASEAAINTAAFGMLTASQRAQYGDDVSFEGMVNNIAISALLGGVIGAGAGALSRRASRLDAAQAQRLETVPNVASSRAVLNDAVTGLVVDGEVKLSPAAAGVVERLSADVTGRRDAAATLARETADAADVPAKAGKVVITPSGTRVEVRPEVVDLSTLQSASGDLQVRDRSRAASAAQIEDIGRNLDPARLMPSIESDRGAPIVGADNIVDSGNGRVAGIRRAYEAYPEQAAAYRKAIEDAGYSTEGMAAPVLISRRVTDLSPEARALFNAEANTPATARMSATELAAMDRAALDDGTLREFADGPVTSADNRAFVERFLANLPGNERAGLVDAQGRLNADGERRIENALVAAAYGDVDAGVVARFAEATDDNTRSVVGALSDVAGRWALMRRAMKAGDISPEFDVTPELTSGLSKLSRWREQAAREGRPVSVVIKEGMGQLDMLDGEMSLEAKAIIRMFYKTDEFKQGAGRDIIAARLGRIVDAAEDLGRPQLFGDAAAATKLGVLDHAVNDDEADLFAAADAGTGAQQVRRGGGQRPAGADRGNAAQAAQVGEGDGRPTVTTKRGEVFVDTRGMGEQFHGSSTPITEFDEGHYNSKNIYGNGFYSTDAVDVAYGYQRKGGGDYPIMYRVVENEPVKFADMDAPVSTLPEPLRNAITETDTMLEPAYASLGKENPSLREVLDELRAISRGEGWSRDEVHEAFEVVRESLADAGYGGMAHRGGGNTGTQEHGVKIYFDPGRDIRLERVSPDEFRPGRTASVDVPREPALDRTAPKPEPRPDGLAEASSRVGRSENLAAVAEQHGVTTDGAFPEQVEIDAIRDTLGADDLAELDAADQVFADAKAYGDALITAARCAFGV